MRLQLLEKLHPSRAGVVLALQRVVRDGGGSEPFDPSLAIRESVLERLLHLVQQRFEVISLEKLVGPSQGTRSGRRLAITFDAGWTDTYSVAFPLLHRLKMPATVFLCTSLIGTGEQLPEERFARLWQTCVLRREVRLLEDDLYKWNGLRSGTLSPKQWTHRFKRLPIDLKLLMLSHLERIYKVFAHPASRQFLSWDEVKHMSSRGISFGSHTARHVSLTMESTATIRKELMISKATIAGHTGQEVDFLAYPNGACDQNVMAMARSAGYKHAFTDKPGWMDSRRDPMALPRVSRFWSGLPGQCHSLDSGSAASCQWVRSFRT